jgi:hypothetical protein
VGNKAVRWAPVDVADRVSAPALFVLARTRSCSPTPTTASWPASGVTGPRKLVMIAGLTHDGLYGPGRGRAMTAAIDWFDRYLKPAGAPAGRKAPERGACNPPPVPPKGEEDANGSGQGHRAQDASARYN